MCESGSHGERGHSGAGCQSHCQEQNDVAALHMCGVSLSPLVVHTQGAIICKHISYLVLYCIITPPPFPGFAFNTFKRQYVLSFFVVSLSLRRSTANNYT